MFFQNSDILYISLKRKSISYFEFKLGGLIEIISWVGCCAAGATCNDRRSLLHTAGGLGGAVSPPVGPGQSPGGGPGGEAPGSSDTFAFSSSK